MDDSEKRGGLGGFVASARRSWLVTFIIIFTGFVSVGTLMFSSGLQAHTGSLHALKTGPDADAPAELGLNAGRVWKVKSCAPKERGPMDDDDDDAQVFLVHMYILMTTYVRASQTKTS